MLFPLANKNKSQRTGTEEEKERRVLHVSPCASFLPQQPIGLTFQPFMSDLSSPWQL